MTYGTALMARKSFTPHRGLSPQTVYAFTAFSFTEEKDILSVCLSAGLLTASLSFSLPPSDMTFVVD